MTDGRLADTTVVIGSSEINWVVDNWPDNSVVADCMLVCNVLLGDELVDPVVVVGWLNDVPLFGDMLEGVILMGV